MIDWISALVTETGAHAGSIRVIVAAILELEDAGDAADDGIQHAGFMGEVKGLMKALKLMGAHSDTIVEAIRQARKEREV